MIKFIEKEPFKSYNYFGCEDGLLYPNFMIKDGKEYFVLNRREPQPEYKDAEDQIIIDFLKRTNGTYTVFYGSFKIPTDFLKYVVEKKYSFEDFSEFIDAEKSSFTDFHGNLKEVSSAFRYRLYDTKLIQDLKKIVELINNKEWEKANELLDKVEIKIPKDDEKEIDICE